MNRREYVSVWASGPNFKSCLHFWKFRITPCLMCGPLGQTFLIPTNFLVTKLVAIHICLNNVWLGETINVWASGPVGKTLLIPPILLQKMLLREDIDVWVSGPNFKKVLLIFGNLRITSCVICGLEGQTFLIPTHFPDTKLDAS